MKTNSLIYTLIFAAVAGLSCNKLVTVAPPVNQLTPDKVFDNAASVIAATSNIYTVLANADGNFIAPVGNYVDEMVNQNADATSLEFSTGVLTSANSNVLGVWQYYYSAIYKSNAVIEGLQNSNSIPDSVRSQCLGEAKFIRAYGHFMLSNIFGDVPLITSTDVTQNSLAHRTPINVIYQNVIADLTDAVALLSPQYPVAGVKIRVNKWAVASMLAKVSLFNNDWATAETQASNVIASGKYTLPANLNNVFLSGSSEAIWQLWNANGFTPLNSVPASGKPSNQLAPSLLTSFEPNDQRTVNWTRSTAVSGITYFYAYKYKQRTATTGTAAEYAVYLRLADVYLIRAEARAQQNNISGAQNDLNMVRNRAGLANTTASDRATLLQAIVHERQIEFFNECGNRFFDLKRSGTINAVMPPLKSLWKPAATLFPIPQTERFNDPNLSQNPGYAN